MLIYNSLSVKGGKINFLVGGGKVLVDILCFVTDFYFEPFADLAYNKDL